MTGTKAGGYKAVATTKSKHGSDFYKKIGAMGGHQGHTGGFAISHEWAAECGRKGGRASTRLGIRNGEGKSKRKNNILSEETKNEN